MSQSITADVKKIKLISHRGNILGPIRELENSPEYVEKALKIGFDVEIDVWFVEGQYFLGHDKPQYKINEDFLQNERFWCHAKNLMALERMLLNNGIHCFWHQNDTATLTSKNIIWTFPGSDPIEGSICVMPEETSEISNKYIGICSDYVARYK
jgi:hypothetical protein